MLNRFTNRRGHGGRIGRQTRALRLVSSEAELVDLVGSGANRVGAGVTVRCRTDISAASPRVALYPAAGVTLDLAGHTLTGFDVSYDGNRTTYPDGAIVQNGTLNGKIVVWDADRFAVRNIVADLADLSAAEIHNGFTLRMDGLVGSAHVSRFVAKNTPCDGVSLDATLNASAENSVVRLLDCVLTQNLGRNGATTNQSLTTHKDGKIYGLRVTLDGSASHNQACHYSSGQVHLVDSTVLGGQVRLFTALRCTMYLELAVGALNEIVTSATDCTVTSAASVEVTVRSTTITRGTWELRLWDIQTIAGATATWDRVRMIQTSQEDFFEVANNQVTLSLVACCVIGANSTTYRLFRTRSNAQSDNVINATNCTFQGFPYVLRWADSDWDFASHRFWHCVFIDNKTAWQGTPAALYMGYYNFSGGFASSDQYFWRFNFLDDPDIGVVDSRYHDQHGRFYERANEGPAGTLAAGANRRGWDDTTDGGAMYAMAGSWTLGTPATWAALVPVAADVILTTLGGTERGALHAKDSGGDIDGNPYQAFEPGCFAVPAA